MQFKDMRKTRTLGDSEWGLSGGAPGQQRLVLTHELIFVFVFEGSEHVNKLRLFSRKAELFMVYSFVLDPSFS